MNSDHSMKVIPADFIIKIKHAIKNKSVVKNIYFGPENKPLIMAMR